MIKRDAPLPVTPVLTLVVLRSGQIVRGHVDIATDANRLWLRRELPGLQLTSGYAWSEVSEVEHRTRVWSAEEFRQSLPVAVTRGKKLRQMEAFPALEHEVTRGERLSAANILFSANDDPNMGTIHPAQASPSLPVATLTLESSLASWDADPELDGLLVTVLPLDEQGNLVPVRGELTLTLVGEIQNINGIHRGARLPQFVELETAHHLLRQTDFAAGPAVVRLPFRRNPPEQRLDLAPYALLHARLGVPTAGVFSASVADVCIRPPSVMRDQLQLYQGSRSWRREYLERLAE
ncbi:MAG: hypothetical protein SFX18_00340 [Pirellulales bacterium]|nr:hypothetical protein [Pirellulales bacterium]